MDHKTYSLEIARRQVNRNERIWKLTYPSGETVFIIIPHGKDGNMVRAEIVRQYALFRGFSFRMVK
jgi:hypothetical protein